MAGQGKSNGQHQKEADQRGGPGTPLGLIQSVTMIADSSWCELWADKINDDLTPGDVKGFAKDKNYTGVSFSD